MGVIKMSSFSLRFFKDMSNVKIAKCKLLRDYSSLLDDNVSNAKIILNDDNTVSVLDGASNYVFDLNMVLDSVYLECFYSGNTTFLKAYAFYDIADNDISIGLTHEYRVLGLRLLVNMHYKAVLILNDDNILLKAFRLDKACDILEENGMILFKFLDGASYLMDIDTFEVFRL